MTKDDAITSATTLAAKHEAPVEVWYHPLSNRFLPRPASKSPMNPDLWTKVLRVNVDGAQILAEDLPKDEVLPPDDFTVPMILTPSEAVTGFAAWLTSQKPLIKVGASQDASIMSKLAKEFIEGQRLDPPRAGWTKALQPYPVAPSK